MLDPVQSFKMMIISLYKIYTLFLYYTGILVRKWIFETFAGKMAYANKRGNMSITGIYTGNKIQNEQLQSVSV